MFVQIIQGKTSEADGVRRMMDRWVDELAPGATGWLGSTSGVTADGDFLAIARFASPEDAQRNSDRREQGDWWAEFAKHLDGEATFANCSDCETFLAGGSDDAGFVQVIKSRVLDRDGVRQAGAAMSDLGPAMQRPELVGGLVALHDDADELTQAVYFTSEAEARKGEATEAPAEVVAAMQQWSEAATDERYYDLTDPWMASPA
jgi:hypothetical protein